jgi:phage shock protein A
MAQTLLQKIQVLVSATLHSIVDRALESNSLAVFDQYIRDAQQSMETLRSALVDLASTTKMLKRKYDEASNEAARLDLEVDAALKADKNVIAQATQAKLNAQLDIARTYQDQYEKQGSTLEMLMQIVTVLETKVEVLESQRDQVATLMALVKSKHAVAKSIKDVQAIADNQGKQVIDRLKSELDVADARLEVTSSRLASQIENEVNDVELNAQLEERRKRLGLS